MSNNPLYNGNSEKPSDTINIALAGETILREKFTDRETGTYTAYHNPMIDVDNVTGHHELTNMMREKISEMASSILNENITLVDDININQDPSSSNRPIFSDELIDPKIHDDKYFNKAQAFHNANKAQASSSHSSELTPFTASQSTTTDSKKLDDGKLASVETTATFFDPDGLAPKVEPSFGAFAKTSNANNMGTHFHRLLSTIKEDPLLEEIANSSHNSSINQQGIRKTKSCPEFQSMQKKKDNPIERNASMSDLPKRDFEPEHILTSQEIAELSAPRHIYKHQS